MVKFVRILISLSISGTLLLLLTYLFKLFYKNSFSKCWQYYIWLIVALRLILPFTPNTTIVGSLFERIDPVTVSDINTAPAIEIVKSDYTYTTESASIHSADTTPLISSIDKYTYIFYIWFCVALVLLIRKVTIYQSFLQYVKAGNTESSNISILNLLSDCEEKLNIKYTVELYQNPLISSPIMIGFIHPSIIIPTRQTDKTKLIYIFMHELVHYKRRDMFYKWFIQIIICIHWFNPFVYVLGKEVNKACELSCDEAVIYTLDNKAQRAYGDTLISSLKTEKTYKNSLASLTLTEGAEQLQERLGAIMNFQKKSKKVFIISILTATVLFINAMVIGAYAAERTDKNSTEFTLSTNNKVLEKDGVFYIFCNDADEANRPSVSITDGSIGFVVVRKDNYTSITGFENLETLVEDVTKQVESMKYISTEEKNMVIELASNISTSSSSTTMEKTGKLTDYNVLTYSLTIEEASNEVQTWIKQCNLAETDIYITEFDNRYWIYTTAIGLNNAFTFNTTCNDANIGTITILPDNSKVGNGYVLLSTPTKYTHLTVTCGNYTAEL